LHFGNDSFAVGVLSYRPRIRLVKATPKTKDPTNCVLLLYAAIFVISAYYFSRTDVARNWLGVITITAFVVHWWMLHIFQRGIEKFRNRLGWIS
jgi:hypothetical protein